MPGDPVHFDHNATYHVILIPALLLLHARGDEIIGHGHTNAERQAAKYRFLAVLELFKQGMIELDQPTTFGDIEIEWTGDFVEKARCLADHD